MKKVLSVVAVSAFVLTAGSAFAGGPGKRQMAMPAGCGEECQAQIDELNASQAQQNEMLAAQAAEIEALKNREDFYNPWYIRGAFKFGWGHQRTPDGRRADGLDTRAIDTDTLFGGQAAVGKMFNAGFGDFRVELEYAYQGGDLDYKSFKWYRSDRDNSGRTHEGDVHLHTVMVNGYYDIPITDFFGAYLTVGVGYGRYNLNAGGIQVVAPAASGGDDGFRDIRWVDGARDVFAYKAGAGVTFNFTDSFALDLGWEFLGTSSTTINDAEVTGIHGHNVVTGLRFMF